jgi:hypothetical protein
MNNVDKEWEEKLRAEFLDMFPFYLEIQKDGYGAEVDDVIDFWLSKLSSHTSQIVEKIEELKAEIIKIEGKEINNWSEIGKVSYYYLDEVLSVIKNK